MPDPKSCWRAACRVGDRPWSRVILKYGIQNLPPAAKGIASLWNPQLWHACFTYIAKKSAPGGQKDTSGVSAWKKGFFSEGAQWRSTRKNCMASRMRKRRLEAALSEKACFGGQQQRLSLSASGLSRPGFVFRLAFFRRSASSICACCLSNGSQRQELSGNQPFLRTNRKIPYT